MIRRFALITTCLAVFLVASGTALAAGGNNVVIATNTADGHAIARSNILVSPVAAPTVTSTNLALANTFACTGCRTVAVAMQAVLITSNASVIEPLNAAAADNSGCNGCATYAFAAQDVLTTGGPVFLSPDAQTQIAALRAEVAADADSGIPFDVLTMELLDAYARFKGVVEHDLQAAGQQPATRGESVWVDPAAGLAG